MEWFSCKDKMPEEHDVYGYHGEGVIMTCSKDMLVKEIIVEGMYCYKVKKTTNGKWHMDDILNEQVVAWGEFDRTDIV